MLRTTMWNASRTQCRRNTAACVTMFPIAFASNCNQQRLNDVTDEDMSKEQ